MSHQKWECFLCGTEKNFNLLPTGYLSNYHPLCNKCADIVLKDETNINRHRMTFHTEIGDFKIISNIPVANNFYHFN